MAVAFEVEFVVDAGTEPVPELVLEESSADQVM